MRTLGSPPRFHCFQHRVESIAFGGSNEVLLGAVSCLVLLMMMFGGGISLVLLSVVSEGATEGV